MEYVWAGVGIATLIVIAGSLLGIALSWWIHRPPN